MLKNENIFKSTLQKRGPIFISDEFKVILESSKLKGIKFELIWDSEN